MTIWKRGRGLFGPLKPLMGAWASPPGAEMPMHCTRALTRFGKGWVNLDARWDMGGPGEYREIAMYGPMADGTLGFYSFTSDGKHSEGRLADGTDIHPDAIAFEAQMPGGIARVTYWPLDDGAGFNFAVESRTARKWNRFFRQEYRPDADGRGA